MVWQNESHDITSYCITSHHITHNTDNTHGHQHAHTTHIYIYQTHSHTLAHSKAYTQKQTKNKKKTHTQIHTHTDKERNLQQRPVKNFERMFEFDYPPEFTHKTHLRGCTE